MKPPVRVLFLASLREAVGQPSLELAPAADAEPLGDLLRRLEATLAPAAWQALRRDGVRIALNQELIEEPYADPDVRVAAGDELAFLPPVTGG